MSADPIESADHETDQVRLLRIVTESSTEHTLDWLEKWIDKRGQRTPGLTVAIRRRRLEIQRERDTRDLPF